MQIRFFGPNNALIETIQADVIPPVGSLVKFPNNTMGVATKIVLEVPPPGLTLQVVDVVVQQSM